MPSPNLHAITKVQWGQKRQLSKTDQCSSKGGRTKEREKLILLKRLSTGFYLELMPSSLMGRGKGNNAVRYMDSIILLRSPAYSRKESLC